MLTFMLHWPDRVVTAVVEESDPTPPDEAVDVSSIDKTDEGPVALFVPWALTFEKPDFLSFLEKKTQGVEGKVTFAATASGMENLEKLFPGGQPIELTMPLPAAGSSANGDNDG